MNDDALRARLVALVIESGDGNITEADIADANGALRGLNYSSLSYMRLIDAIENDLGVYIDPDAGTEPFESLDTLVPLVRKGMESVEA
ncbi:hypothetical protein ACFYPN_13820 [Streptomyces sp. NPDC005576]|uniref:hypothetical protein n=1 Tax=unclassified Streptomyces TaxID=2593676 RepID=UPI0034002077